MTRHFQTEIECLWSLQQISGTFNIVITVAWECIFLFWGWLYFCKLPAIYCNLLATPLFKSQTLQFIAGGWKRGKYENNARQKLVRTRNDWSCRENRTEDIIKILSKYYQNAVNDDADDEDGDGSKVSDNLREKLVSKENKVVSKKLGKAYIIYTTSSSREKLWS